MPLSQIYKKYAWRIKRGPSDFPDSDEYVFFVRAFLLLPQFDFFMIEHLLFLVLGELEYSNQREDDIQGYMIGPDFLADVQLLKDCVDAMPYMHQVALQLHYLLGQTVNYNTYLFQLLELARLEALASCHLQGLGFAECQGEMIDPRTRFGMQGAAIIDRLSSLLLSNTNRGLAFLFSYRQLMLRLTGKCLCLDFTFFLQLLDLFVEQIHKFLVLDEDCLVLGALATSVLAEVFGVGMT